MKALLSVAGVFVVIAVAIILNASLYTVDVREQVIITQFSQIKGEPIKEPGLHFKMPFIQKINRFSNQVLEWDGPSAQMPTRDKLIIVVDNFARWRIKDPLIFFQQVTDVRTAHSRLDTLIGGAVRDVVASHDFIESIRSDKTRKPERDEALAAADSRIGTLPSIQVGREQLERLVLTSAKESVARIGVELLDVRFKRLNYNPNVSQTIYQRMSSEREQIAERFRSEGDGEAAKILGNRDRDLKQIESEAYKKIQEIEGGADAKATEIYAKAYNQTPEAVQLFEFTKAMDTLKKTVTPDMTLVLTTDSDLLHYLKTAEPLKPGGKALDVLKGVGGTGINGLPSLLDIPSK